MTKNHKSGDLKHLLSHRCGSSVSEPEVQTGSALSETSREGFFLPFPTLGGSLAILGSLHLQPQHFAHCVSVSLCFSQGHQSFWITAHPNGVIIIY